jgi:two-component system cell cycle response regulator
VAEQDSMPRILTVDDSSTIRSIVTKQMVELGFEVDQAEDGTQGLAKLEEIEFDLVLLDVTMPVMDGPTMLGKMREAGNMTPVVMLTSESKRSIMAGAIKAGIDDYILKPFKPEELRAKVLKALKMDRPAMPAAAAGADLGHGVAAPSAHAADIPSPGSRQFIDVLVIDDMENVHKKLRTLLPAHISLNGCTSAREALQFCKDRVYRVIVVDLVIPDVNSAVLMNQLRALQPHAVMVALALRSANDVTSEAKSQGFQDVMCKPFDPAAIDEFMARHFAVEDVLVVDGNVLTAAKFEGKDEKLDRYFNRLATLCKESIEKLASACYEAAIFDLTAIPVKNDKVVRLLIEADKEAKNLGLVPHIVGTDELKKALSMVTETASLAFYADAAAARAAA